MNKKQHTLNGTWAKEALDLVWQQQPPASWQVFQGKKTPSSCSLLFLFAVFIPLFCPVAAFVALIVLKGGYSEGKAPYQIHHPPIWPDLNAPLYCLISVAIIIGLVLTLVLIGNARAARRERKQSAPILIVLPEGWVEYVGWRDSIVSVAFAELADLQRETAPSQGITTLAELRGKAPLPASDTGLVLTFPDGKKETWEPRINCDAPTAICQAILVAYSHYLARSAS